MNFGKKILLVKNEFVYFVRIGERVARWLRDASSILPRVEFLESVIFECKWCQLLSMMRVNFLRHRMRGLEQLDYTVSAAERRFEWMLPLPRPAQIRLQKDGRTLWGFGKDKNVLLTNLVYCIIIDCIVLFIVNIYRWYMFGRSRRLLFIWWRSAACNTGGGRPSGSCAISTICLMWSKHDRMHVPLYRFAAMFLAISFRSWTSVNLIVRCACGYTGGAPRWCWYVRWQ